MALPVYGKSHHGNQYEILTKQEVLMKLFDMTEECKKNIDIMKLNGLEDTAECNIELGKLQGIFEAIYVVKFMKKS